VAASAIAVALGAPERSLATAPRAQVVVEAISALCQLFGAVVLVLVAQGPNRDRLRWAAAGLVILAIGHLTFGNLWPMAVGAPNPNASLYAWLATSGTAACLFVLGLVPRAVPRLSTGAVAVALVAFAALCGAAIGAADRLPRLIALGSLEAAAARPDTPLSGLTPWHWAFAASLVALLLAATVGAVRAGRGQSWRGCLAAAMALLAGAEVHNALWPAAYSAVLTGGAVLQLAFGAVVAVGGTFALWRMAAERAGLLSAERAHAAGLIEIAALKADFTAMVAHELVSPIAAIRAHAAVLAGEECGSARHRAALAAIQAETDVLHALAGDVRGLASDERDDFPLAPRAVPVLRLLGEAAVFNGALPGDHPLTIRTAAREEVRADPERIGQVLRNLLANAAAYTPAGSPIELSAARDGARVRIAVVDHGPGVEAAERRRIFEKYGRGRSGREARVGAGLGLYLSRRIVRAHGGELSVEPTPGGGATFAFDLPLAEPGTAAEGR
jgi:signal transduction histidine kinase